jgi:hypothetical protein
MPKQLDPAGFARAILLEASDIPADMTIAQWREKRQAEAPRARRPRRTARRRGRRRAQLRA